MFTATGWAILSHDVSDIISRQGKQTMSADENEAFLDGLAAIHAKFWEHPALSDPMLGLGNLQTYLAFSDPEKCRREANSAILPQAIVEGWSLMSDMLEPEVAGIVGDLRSAPRL